MSVYVSIKHPNLLVTLDALWMLGKNVSKYFLDCPKSIQNESKSLDIFLTLLGNKNDFFSNRKNVQNVSNHPSSFGQILYRFK